MKLLSLITMFLWSVTTFAQTTWYNPETSGAKVHGQLLQNEKRTNFYQRLPDIRQKEVTQAVWSLSQNNAGESIHFYTNSKRIVVRYGLSEGYSMSHMPATGKSGVDLYAYDENGVEKWCAGRNNFGDTTYYNFDEIYYKNPMHKLGYEYQLWLPTYNSVTWMEIGVDEGSFFEFIEPSTERPIIAYGTSITQGACASRPGMIWTNILSRELSTPIMNLGFSGNGLLEKGILDIIKITPAKLIIIDCMPNLMERPKAELTALIVNAVKEIRKGQPTTPILFTDHLGYPHSTIVKGWHEKVANAVDAQRAAYESLLASGVLGLHYLSYSEIAMPQDATVEAIHPTDWGMKVYSDAYYKKICPILSVESGEYSTEKPVTQRREPQVYEWKQQHQNILKSNAVSAPKTVIIGNSIMQQWGGIDGFRIKRDSIGWAKKIAPTGAVNMGAGWDRVENILWRIYHGALDGYDAKRVILTIGVNNLGINTDEEILSGIKRVVYAIKLRQPKAEIKLNGIFPARSQEERIKTINLGIEKIAGECGVKFSNPGELLLMTNGKVDPTLLLNDGLHLNQNGYKRIVDEFIK